MLEIINNLGLFLEDFSREISIREYSRLKKIAPVTAGKILRKLTNENLLKQRKERGYILFRANGEDFNLKKLSLVYWRDKLDGLISKLNDFYNYPTIILFGSIEKCENNLNSDIDLAVISEKKSDFKKVEEFEKKIKREIQIFTFENVDKIKNKNLANNILNGAKLSGEIQWT